jgi:hypothetical protein
MKEIRFVFMCRRKQDFDVHADNRGDVEKLEDFLAKHTLAHRCKKEKDSAFNVTGGYFTIGSTIPVAIHFSANIEKSAIDVHLVNFEEIGGRTAQIKPDQITDDLLDELGKYILRQENRFLKLELSEEERMRIRAQVKAAQQQMDKAVSIADATLRAEALERKDGGLLKFFRSR